jgi:hypothetical protein
MNKQGRGFTLVETLIASIMVAAMIGALTLIFQVMAAGWSAHGGRIGTGVTLNRAVEDIARTLRSAKDVASQNPGFEIRFTVVENSTDKFRIYYLYSQGDGLYQLRKADLSGGIGGAFTYGSGDIVARDILPPSVSNLSCSGKVATIDLSMRRVNSTVRLATKVAARNI